MDDTSGNDGFDRAIDALVKHSRGGNDSLRMADEKPDAAEPKVLRGSVDARELEDAHKPFATVEFWPGGLERGKEAVLVVLDASGHIPDVKLPEIWALLTPEVREALTLLTGIATDEAESIERRCEEHPYYERKYRQEMNDIRATVATLRLPGAR